MTGIAAIGAARELLWKKTLLVQYDHVWVVVVSSPDAHSLFCQLNTFVCQVGRLRIQIFGFAMVGTLFMVSAIWYHPLTTRGGLGAPVSFTLSHRLYIL